MLEPKERRLGRWNLAFWIGVAAVTTLCVVVRFWGDVVGPLRLVVFGPRYLIALPLFLLAGVLLVTRSRWQTLFLVLVSAASFLLLMDFRFGTGRDVPVDSDLVVMTLNVQVSTGNEEAVYDLIESHGPDFVALQETVSDAYRFPPEYDTYDYGELTFGTLHDVVHTPEQEYCFRGRISDVVVMPRYLAPSFFASGKSLAEVPATEVLSLSEQPIRPESQVTPGGLRTLELKRNLKSGFTLGALLSPTKPSGQIEFILDYGDTRIGGNVYRVGERLLVGSWRQGKEHWLEADLPSDRQQIPICVSVSVDRTDLYIDGKSAGSMRTATAMMRTALAVGTFANSTRTRLDRFFPYRRIRFLVDTGDGRLVEFTNIHNPTPRHALAGTTGEDYQWFSEKCNVLARQTREASRNDVPRIVAGDFNLPVESQLYRRLWGGYRNAFSNVGKGLGPTKHTVFQGISYGTRIDHILTNGTVRPIHAEVLDNVGSDHSPLIATLRLSNTGILAEQSDK